MNYSCVKELLESGVYNSSVPSKYVYHFKNNSDDLITWDQARDTIPTVDFSLLTSNDPNKRFKAVEELGRACSDWGFFMVINHQVPHSLMDKMVNESDDFFSLSVEEKREYAGKGLFDPIRCGTSFNVKVDNTMFWRDYLKIHVHPQFNAPAKPICYSETVREYCERTRELASEVMRGISKSLGLEEDNINKKMGIDCHQLLVVNSYPPCPQPDVAVGLPPHTDHGLLTLLMQNHMSGLQVCHAGKWVPIVPPPYAFLVNLGDHMEILTNGKYKSVVHRAMVNNKATRISIGTSHGPSLDTVVTPIKDLIDDFTKLPSYRGISYRAFMQLQQNNQLNGKSCLEFLRLLSD